MAWTDDTRFLLSDTEIDLCEMTDDELDRFATAMARAEERPLRNEVANESEASARPFALPAAA